MEIIMSDDTTTTETAAETSGDGAEKVTATETTTEATEGEKALGDAGKKALDAMKAERNTDREARKKLEAEFAEFKAKAEGKEAEFAAQQEAQRVRDEALGAANKKILNSEIKAAAKGVLADPQDAYKFLDLDSFEVDADGNVDDTAIANAITKLITDKPYLAAQGGKKFQGSADGGARNDAGTPAQLTQADLKGMSPEAIVAAKAEGRLNDVLGVKP